MPPEEENTRGVKLPLPAHAPHKDIAFRNPPPLDGYNNKLTICVKPAFT